MIRQTVLAFMTLLLTTIPAYLGYLFISDPLTAYLYTGHLPETLESMIGLHYLIIALILLLLALMGEMRAAAIVLFGGAMLAAGNAYILWHNDASVSANLIAGGMCFVLSIVWLKGRKSRKGS